MKKLLDAFLELPTWQGVLCIVAFCVIEAALLVWIAHTAYRRSCFDADAKTLNRLNQATRSREAIRS